MFARVAPQIFAQRAKLLNLMKLDCSQTNVGLGSRLRNISTTIYKRQDEVKGDGSINISYEEMVQHLKNPSSLVIDVRNPEELVETGMFPGSINIPLPILSETLDLPDDKFHYLYGVPKPVPQTDIIFSCKLGIRSHKAIMLALGKGFQRVRHYPGGWLEWVEKQPK